MKLWHAAVVLLVVLWWSSRSRARADVVPTPQNILDTYGVLGLWNPIGDAV